MKTQKQHQFDKLRKSSMLFTQLGLVLALLIVYLVLELKFEKIIPEYNPDIPDEPLVWVNPYETFEIERIVKKQETPKVKNVVPTQIFTTTSEDIPIAIIDPQPSYNSSPSTNTIIEVIEPEDVDETVIFKVLEDAPVFPGCEGLEGDEGKQCFSTKLRQFVNKKFNTGIAEGLNMSGRQTIWTSFTINKEGEIAAIEVRAPHARLEKEALRVIEKLPKMTPGKQRLRPVNVTYTLPIIFDVQ